MRIYKFLCSKFALKSIHERRLKISLANDLNDPFDLIPFNVSNRTHRWALKAAVKELTNQHGLLCFSLTWRDPLMWAHYSDKHRGMCLEFDIPSPMLKKVTYVQHRLPFPSKPVLKDSNRMLFTKFRNWAYEEEVRAWATLEEEEDGLFFKRFDNALRLRAVIVGARCEVSRQTLTENLRSEDRGIKIVKARAGFKRFEVVRDERGFGS
jgi:Protein of unknown function (DUF2971)